LFGELKRAEDLVPFEKFVTWSMMPRPLKDKLFNL